MDSGNTLNNKIVVYKEVSRILEAKRTFVIKIRKRLFKCLGRILKKDMANLTCWKQEDLRKTANNQTTKLVIIFDNTAKSRDGKTAKLTKSYRGKAVVVSPDNPAPERTLHPLTTFNKLSSVLQNDTRYPILLILNISKIKQIW